MFAIESDDDDFHNDGRHVELVELIAVISEALGIKPWEDLDAIVREAISAIKERG